jgi:aspartyl-tRNA(Asn)/glutamyl-tRNA(Gln) amidotransferase subunit C
MSKINKDTVDKLAHLARLEFDNKSGEDMVKGLNDMLAFVDKLNELDTSNVEPLIYMTDETNVLREDEVKQTITQKQALQNAPQKDSDYFKVPKVVKK